MGRLTLWNINMSKYQVKLSVHLVLRRDGYVLLSRRQDTGYFDGYWGLPAGHVEPGELAHDAMVREAEEEIGITISPVDLKLEHVMHHLKPGAEAVDYIHLFFTTAFWGGDVKNCELEKCSDLEWFMNRPSEIIPYIQAALKNGGPYSVFEAL